MQQKDIVIVGAGLVGSLLAIYLARRGYNIKIFERRPDMRKTKINEERSINLALSDRGLLALKKVGLVDEVKKISIPMHGRYIHNLDGSTAFQPYGKEGQYINSVSRAMLNMKLIDFAGQQGISIFFREKCIGIDWSSNRIEFENTNSSQRTDIRADIIFGADGAFSATRLQHQLHSDRFDYHQFYIDCGYKELSISPGLNGEFALMKNALHIWPRKDFMMIALPNLNGSFTCTLFFPVEGEPSFESLNTEEKVVDFFKETFPDALQLMPALVQDFFHNPTSSLVTVKCFPWIRDDKFALIGDAAHAIVPFYGQGMNCGFEDCRILNEFMDKHNDDWKTILRKYQIQRKPDADAIADLAVENFIEMRERTADPKFLLQKKIEARLHEKYPEKWIPAYTQVTFSPGIRYSDALKRSSHQEKIMQQIMRMPDIEKKWESEEIEQLILSKL
ncbi:MAG TPA: NAD(P)/FAD-dependent oxidoreductase [Chitinophagaceae bacterium]|jgi:kynurenine 3-monooxygenase